jgi:hypothetical protein
MSRHQMVAAAEWMAQMFAAAQSLHGALHLLHSQAAEDLRVASSPVEVAYIQWGLLVSGAQEGMRCWQDMLLAGMRQAPSRAAKQAPEQSPEAQQAEAAAAMAANAASAAMNAAAPMMQAWQAFLANAGQSAHH